jgi:hypothetical protein
MKLANATNLYRKSGVAEWRDLQFCFSTPVLPPLPQASQLLGITN